MENAIAVILFLLLTPIISPAQNHQIQYQSDLEIYLTVSDGKPASIVCDLGLEVIAPANGFPICEAITVWLKQPDENGLPLDKELDLIAAAEDKLSNQLSGAANAFYAGRVSFDGATSFYFYAQDSIQFQQYGKSAIRAALPGYAFEIMAQADEQWEVYNEMLFPDAESMNTIENRRVIERLENAGDRLWRPRVITHTAIFKTESGREAFQQGIIKLRFKVEGKTENSGDMPYELTFSRRDAIEEDFMNKITWDLCRLASKNNGFYDGWDCPIFK